MTLRASGDDRCGGTRWMKNAASWILDVGVTCVTCSGSQRLVRKGADTIPGKAAAAYDDNHEPLSPLSPLPHDPHKLTQ
jgi:hypothetical protein